MTRPKNHRIIGVDPGVTFFKPSGIPVRLLDQVDLSLDELEVLRLKYYMDLDIIGGAEEMKISKSTFQRLLMSACGKLADALVNGKAIKLHKIIDFNYPNK